MLCSIVLQWPPNTIVMSASEVVRAGLRLLIERQDAGTPLPGDQSQPHG
jgi:hypothetical protein